MTGMTGNWRPAETISLEAFTAALLRAAGQVHDAWAALSPRQHRRQCRTCHPRSVAGKLAVDGHGYQRRIRNRRKRGH